MCHYTCPCVQQYYIPSYVPPMMPHVIPHMMPYFPPAPRYDYVVKPEAIPHVSTLAEESPRQISSEITSSDFETERECDVPSNDEACSTACERSQTDNEHMSETDIVSDSNIVVHKTRLRKRGRRKKIPKVVEEPAVEEPVVEEPAVEEIVVKKQIKKRLLKKTKKTPKIKRKKDTSIDDAFLQEAIMESQAEQKRIKTVDKVHKLCFTFNSILGVCTILMGRIDTKCYSEAVVLHVKNFLNVKEPSIVLGNMNIDETVTLRYLDYHMEFILGAMLRFDKFYASTRFSDLVKEKSLDLCYKNLMLCIDYCRVFHKFFFELVKDQFDLSLVPGIVQKINVAKKWYPEIREVVGEMLDHVTYLYPSIDWPVKENIRSYEDLFILSNCTWGMLAFNDQCVGCKAIRGIIIYSTCCQTRQVFCKCSVYKEEQAIACQNSASECCLNKMNIKELFDHADENREIFIQKIASLSTIDKTFVPQLVSPFNTIDNDSVVYDKDEIL